MEVDESSHEIHRLVALLTLLTDDLAAYLSVPFGERNAEDHWKVSYRLIVAMNYLFHFTFSEVELLEDDKDGNDT